MNIVIFVLYMWTLHIAYCDRIEIDVESENLEDFELEYLKEHFRTTNINVRKHVGEDWQYIKCSRHGEIIPGLLKTSYYECRRARSGKIRPHRIDCDKGKIFDITDKHKCQSIPGGGYLICVIPKSNCSNKQQGLIPHPNHNKTNMYLKCNKNSIYLLKCIKHDAYYDPVKQTCIRKNLDTRLKSDESNGTIIPIKCTKPGVIFVHPNLKKQPMCYFNCLLGLNIYELTINCPNDTSCLNDTRTTSFTTVMSKNTSETTPPITGLTYFPNGTSSSKPATGSTRNSNITSHAVAGTGSTINPNNVTKTELTPSNSIGISNGYSTTIRITNTILNSKSINGTTHEIIGSTISPNTRQNRTTIGRSLSTIISNTTSGTTTNILGSTHINTESVITSIQASSNNNSTVKSSHTTSVGTRSTGNNNNATKTTSAITSSTSVSSGTISQSTIDVTGSPTSINNITIGTTLGGSSSTIQFKATSDTIPASITTSKSTGSTTIMNHTTKFSAATVTPNNATEPTFSITSSTAVFSITPQNTIRVTGVTLIPTTNATIPNKTSSTNFTNTTIGTIISTSSITTSADKVSTNLNSGTISKISGGINSTIKTSHTDSVGTAIAIINTTKATPAITILTTESNGITSKTGSGTNNSNTISGTTLTVNDSTNISNSPASTRESTGLTTNSNAISTAVINGSTIISKGSTIFSNITTIGTTMRTLSTINVTARKTTNIGTQITTNINNGTEITPAASSSIVSNRTFEVTTTATGYTFGTTSNTSSSIMNSKTTRKITPVITGSIYVENSTFAANRSTSSIALSETFDTTLGNNGATTNLKTTSGTRPAIISSKNIPNGTLSVTNPGIESTTNTEIATSDIFSIKKSTESPNNFTETIPGFTNLVLTSTVPQTIIKVPGTTPKPLNATTLKTTGSTYSFSNPRISTTIGTSALINSNTITTPTMYNLKSSTAPQTIISTTGTTLDHTTMNTNNNTTTSKKTTTNNDTTNFTKSGATGSTENTTVPTYHSTGVGSKLTFMTNNVTETTLPTTNANGASKGIKTTIISVTNTTLSTVKNDTTFDTTGSALNSSTTSRSDQTVSTISTKRESLDLTTNSNLTTANTISAGIKTVTGNNAKESTQSITSSATIFNGTNSGTTIYPTTNGTKDKIIDSTINEAIGTTIQTSLYTTSVDKGSPVVRNNISEFTTATTSFTSIFPYTISNLTGTSTNEGTNLSTNTNVITSYTTSIETAGTKVIRINITDTILGTVNSDSTPQPIIKVTDLTTSTRTGGSDLGIPNNITSQTSGVGTGPTDLSNATSYQTTKMVTSTILTPTIPNEIYTTFVSTIGTSYTRVNSHITSSKTSSVVATTSTKTGDSGLGIINNVTTPRSISIGTGSTVNLMNYTNSIPATIGSIIYTIANKTSTTLFNATTFATTIGSTVTTSEVTVPSITTNIDSGTSNKSIGSTLASNNTESISGGTKNVIVDKTTPGSTLAIQPFTSPTIRGLGNETIAITSSVISTRNQTTAQIRDSNILSSIEFTTIKDNSTSNNAQSMIPTLNNSSATTVYRPIKETISTSERTMNTTMLPNASSINSVTSISDPSAKTTKTETTLTKNNTSSKTTVILSSTIRTIQTTKTTMQTINQISTKIDDDSEEVANYVCKKTGKFRLLNTCTKFYQCKEKDDGDFLVSQIRTCPSCLKFNALLGKCDFPENVPECAKDDKKPNRYCTKEGHYPVPGACNKFYECKKTENIIALSVINCPRGETFNPIQEKCDKRYRCRRYDPTCLGPNDNIIDRYDCAKAYICNEKQRICRIIRCPKGFVFNTIHEHNTSSHCVVQRNSTLCDWN